MRKLSVTFAALAIAFAVSSAFKTAHKTVYHDWFAINGTVSVYDFINTYFDDITTYDPPTIVQPPTGCSSELFSNVCAVIVNHSADEFELQQSDLTGQSPEALFNDILYKN